MLPVFDQIIMFLLVMLLGVTAGIFFDFYRTLRSFWRPGRVGTVVGDMLFWIVLTIFSYAYLLFSTGGEVRIYVFLSIVLGVLLYLRLLSTSVRKIITRVFKTLIKISKFLMRIIGRILRLKEFFY